jgi:hypothetical protein
MPRTRHSYTPAEIDTSLLVLAMTGRNSVVAARRLKSEGINVNPRTLRSWRQHTHAKRYIDLEHQHAPEIERQMMGQTRAIVTAANDATLEAIEASRQQVENGDARDPSTVARNLATVSGIQTDKGLLLDGRPTVIHGDGSLDELVARMEREMGFDIDSTAEEERLELGTGKTP